MTVRPLPAALVEIARSALNEDPKRVRNDLQHIKEWLVKQQHLRARSDDQWILAFLRGCKFSLERTKEKLDLYYSVRNTIPDFFKIKYNHPAFNDILDTGSFLILPRVANPDSPRVVIIRPGSYDPDKFTVPDIISMADVLLKILFMEDDNTVVSGIITLYDLEGVKLGHYLQMTPMNMKKLVVIVQEGVPIRMKGTHYINTPPGFETFFNAVKNLLNEKNRNRLYAHNKNYDALYEHIPKEILPAEYGGNCGTVKEITDSWKNKVEKYSQFLDEDLQYGVDESKRHDKMEVGAEVFGIDGSFRSLEVD